MPKDDTKKDFDEAYTQAVEKWWPFWQQAKSDIRFKLGNPYSERDKTRLKKQERDAHVWNKCRRMANLLSGWERKNRLSIKIDPIEGADRKTVQQISGAVQYSWRKPLADFYLTISAAYEKGPVTCGLNLTELYLDYRDDPLYGDVNIVRLPYNRFLLDPYFTQADLSDCQYVLTRDWMTDTQVLMMLPNIRKRDLPEAKGRDQKFPDASPAKDFRGKHLHRVDRFFRRDTKKVYLLVEPRSGMYREFEGQPKDLEMLLDQEHPMMGVKLGALLKPERVNKATVKLGLLIDDKQYYDDEEPYGIGDYPFTAHLGYYEPEHDDWRTKLCGVIRDMRDPQTESNRRRLKLYDIMDNFLDAVVAKKSALVNPKAAYQRGPLVLWLNDDAEMGDVQIMRGGGAVNGLLESIQLADKDLEEIPGGNETLMGLPNKDDPQEAWIMGKLRMQAGLTIFEPMIDNHRSAVKSLGDKTAKMIRANYPKHKISRMINEPPSPLFYDKDFIKYDCMAVEGLLTASQRQMKHAQLLAMSNMPPYQGKIPLSMLLESSDLELSDDFITNIKKMEGMQQQVTMAKLMLEGRLIQAESKEAEASAAYKQAQAQNQMAQVAKIMAELQKIPEDRMMKIFELALQIDKDGAFGLEGNSSLTQGQMTQPPVTTR